MTKCLFPLILIVSWILVPACHRYEDRFDAIAIRCGMSEAEVSASERIFQIQQDEYFQPAMQLTARYTDGQGFEQRLTVSPLGCIAAPGEGGLLQILDPISKHYLSKRFLKKTTQAKVQLVSLQKKSTSNLQINCPGGMLYSPGSLGTALKFTSREGWDALELRLVLRGEKGEQELWKKMFGERETSIPEQLLPMDLDEGQYQIVLKQRSFMDEWDQVPESPEQTCPLRLQKSAPRVQKRPPSTSLTGRTLVLRKGEALPFVAASPIPASLFVCREKQIDDEDRAFPDSCVAQDKCTRGDDFSPVETTTADSPGVFHYFFFAVDAAGNRSDMSCDTLTVTDASTRLEVKWSNARWNIPLAVMETAETVLDAKVIASHAQLSDADLLDNLECKVDFIRNDQSPLSGGDVTCGSGRCFGLDLGQFRPCDDTIRLNLDRFWQSKAQRLQLRLHVRATARDGQSEVQTRSLWIYPQRFQPRLMMHSDEGADAIYESIDQLIVLRQNTNLLQWDETKETWISSGLPLSAKPTKLRTVQGSDGSIYAAYRVGDKYQAAVLLKTSWLALPDDPRIERCLSTMEPHPGGGFWCQRSGNDAVVWQNESWRDAGLPAACSPLGRSQFQPAFAVGPSGKIVVSCFGNLIYQESSLNLWEPIPPDFSAFSSLAVDEKERVWVLSNVASPARRIAYYENSSWHDVPFPAKVREVDRFPNLFGRQGRIHLDDYVWNEREQTWTLPGDIALKFPESRTRSVIDRKGNEILVLNHGLGLRTSSRINYYPLAAFAATLDELSLPLLDSKGRLWFQGNVITGSKRPLHRIDPVAWQSYEDEAGIRAGRANANISNLWLNDESLPEFFYSETGLQQGKVNGWSTVFGNRYPDGPLTSVIRSRRGEYYGHNFISLFRIGSDGRKSLIRTFDNTFDLAETSDSQGRLWLREMGTRSLWMVNQEGAHLYPAPESFDPRDHNSYWIILDDRITVANGPRLFRWDDASRSWQASTSHTGIRKAGSHHLVILENQNLILLDVMANTREKIPATPTGAFDKFYYKTWQLYFIDTNAGLYVLKNGSWETLLSTKALRKFMPGNVFLSNVQVDPWNRIWIYGTPFHLLRLDQNSP